MTIEIYQKEEVLPYMRGMWMDALKSVCGVPAQSFNGKHQSCPNCGGKDRFRWTDNLKERGDGGAYCSQCGADTGIGWLMKLTDENYSECINILGRFLGKVPQEYVVKRNKIASSAPAFSFARAVSHENCHEVMLRTKQSEQCRLAMSSGLMTDSALFNIGVSSSGSEFVTIPCFMINAEGPADEMCNVMMIGEDGAVKHLAGRSTSGSAAVIGCSDKSIYLCTSWVEGMHVHISTSQEVWVCYDGPNIDMVANAYKGDRELRVACQHNDFHSLCAAEQNGLKVIIPNNGCYSMGIQRKLYDARDLLGN